MLLPRVALENVLLDWLSQTTSTGIVFGSLLAQVTLIHADDRKLPPLRDNDLHVLIVQYSSLDAAATPRFVQKTTILVFIYKPPTRQLWAGEDLHVCAITLTLGGVLTSAKCLAHEVYLALALVDVEAHAPLAADCGRLLVVRALVGVCRGSFCIGSSVGSDSYRSWPVKV